MADLLDALPVTNDDMLGCARRELKQRIRVYARQVELKHMKADVADRELRFMAAIVAHFERLVCKPLPDDDIPD